MPKVQADGLPLPQRYGAILTIVIGISMAVLDGAIATDLHATPASSIWVVNAYQIAIVISLLSFSFLGDMFGYRRIYKCGLVVFCCLHCSAPFLIRCKCSPLRVSYKVSAEQR